MLFEIFDLVITEYRIAIVASAEYNESEIWHAFVIFMSHIFNWTQLSERNSRIGFRYLSFFCCCPCPKHDTLNVHIFQRSFGRWESVKMT